VGSEGVVLRDGRVDAFEGVGAGDAHHCCHGFISDGGMVARVGRENARPKGTRLNKETR
jgi:hypothetical protein